VRDYRGSDVLREIDTRPADQKALAREIQSRPRAASSTDPSMPRQAGQISRPRPCEFRAPDLTSSFVEPQWMTGA
jgi:hypothetical protein